MSSFLSPSNPWDGLEAYVDVGSALANIRSFLLSLTAQLDVAGASPLSTPSLTPAAASATAGLAPLVFSSCSACLLGCWLAVINQFPVLLHCDCRRYGGFGCYFVLAAQSV